MTPGKVILPFTTKEDIKAAAIFISALIENSTVVFSTEMEYLERKNNMVVKFTGGC